MKLLNTVLIAILFITSICGCGKQEPVKHTVVPFNPGEYIWGEAVQSESNPQLVEIKDNSGNLIIYGYYESLKEAIYYNKDMAVDLNLCNLDLSRIDLSKGDFRGCDFENSNFIGTDLSDTNFNNCNFKNADLSNTTVTRPDSLGVGGTSFAGANLKDTNLSGSKGWDSELDNIWSKCNGGKTWNQYIKNPTYNSKLNPKTIIPKVVKTTTTPASQNNEYTVYVTNTGECYHSIGCGSLSRSCIPMNYSEAIQRYRPCSKCNP